MLGILQEGKTPAKVTPVVLWFPDPPKLVSFPGVTDVPLLDILGFTLPLLICALGLDLPLVYKLIKIFGMTCCL